jgi:hypothetical protein
MSRRIKTEREYRQQINLQGATRVWGLIDMHGDKAVAVAI